MLVNKELKESLEGLSGLVRGGASFGGFFFLRQFILVQTMSLYIYSEDEELYVAFSKLIKE